MASDSGYVAYLTRIIDRAIEVAGLSVKRVVDWGSGPNPVCADLLRSHGFDVSIWDPFFAQDSQPPAGSFDLALCIEVAEHFFDPVSDFGSFASLLKPGGFAAVHTQLAPPDDADFLRWWYIEDTTHVSFYSEASLRHLARSASLFTLSVEDECFAFFRKPLPVLVAGGANLDIEGRPHAKLIPADSNPGTVRFSSGGAGRNVAEDLGRLGLAVELVTAIGSDSAGTELLERTAAAGVGTAGFECMEGEASSCYLSVLDADGDMAVAVNGMAIYDRFDAKRVLAAAERTVAKVSDSSHLSGETAPFSAVVLDGNLLPETAEALLDRFPDLPAWFDPVSTPKARRFAAYKGGALLARLAMMKPNLIEAETMAAEVGAAAVAGGGVAVAETTAGAAPAEGNAAQRATAAAHALRSAGVGGIYVSLGVDGVYRLEADAEATARPPTVDVLSATGAGDAFLAGSLRARILGLGAAEECAAGCAAAVTALGSPHACPPTLNAVAFEAMLSAWKRSGAIAWKEKRT